jgi:hypothetical protein
MARNAARGNNEMSGKGDQDSVDSHNPTVPGGHSDPADSPIKEGVVAEGEGGTPTEAKRVGSEQGVTATQIRGPAERTDLVAQREARPQSSSRDKMRASRETESVCVLPNGTVGKPYSEDISKLFLKSDGIVDCEIEGIEDSGLILNMDDRRIEGVPQRAGDYALVLKYRYRDMIDPRRFFERRLSVTINPEPRSLWKDLPSDRNDLYWKTDSESSAILGEKHLIAASRRGRSHAHEGRFRDDAFRTTFLDSSGWYIAAVADGAGSAKYSRKGSEIACESVTRGLVEKINLDFGEPFQELLAGFKNDHEDIKRKRIGDLLYAVLGSSVFEAYKDIQTEAKNNDARISDYATTLLVALCKKYDFGWFVASYWVGDGAIGIYQKGSPIRIMGEPDGGEFAGQTRFLTTAEIWEAKEIYRRLRFEITNDFTALVLMTDGVSDHRFQTDSELRTVEKWDEFWNELSTAVNFDRSDREADKKLLDWLDFWSPGNHDDRTLAILC